jgi:Molecular chaperone (small heat shock protein)
MSDQTDPFDEVERFLDQLTEFGGVVGADVPVDVVDEGDAFVVVVDLPGYETDELDVQLQDDRQLTVSATREAGAEPDGDDYVRRERSRQQPTRSVTLPDPVDEGATEPATRTASYGSAWTSGRGHEGTEIPVN